MLAMFSMHLFGEIKFTVSKCVPAAARQLFEKFVLFAIRKYKNVMC